MPPKMDERLDALKARLTALEGSLNQTLEEFRRSMMSEFAKLRDRRLPEESSPGPGFSEDVASDLKIVVKKLNEEPKQILEKEMRKTDNREAKVKKSSSAVVDTPPPPSPDTALFKAAMKKTGEASKVEEETKVMRNGSMKTHRSGILEDPNPKTRERMAIRKTKHQVAPSPPLKPPDSGPPSTAFLELDPPGIGPFAANLPRRVPPPKPPDFSADINGENKKRRKDGVPREMGREMVYQEKWVDKWYSEELNCLHFPCLDSKFLLREIKSI